MPKQQLRASPLQLERHEFLRIELHAAESGDVNESLPLKLHRNWAPSDDDPRRWRLILQVNFGGEKEGAASLYSGQLRIAGFFRVVEQYPTEKMQDLVGITGASMLYGACREMLANLTARGPHGMVSLPSVSFVPLKEEPTPQGPGEIEKTPRPRRKRKAPAAAWTAATSKPTTS